MRSSATENLVVYIKALQSVQTAHILLMAILTATREIYGSGGVGVGVETISLYTYMIIAIFLLWYASSLVIREKTPFSMLDLMKKVHKVFSKSMAFVLPLLSIIASTKIILDYKNRKNKEHEIDCSAEKNEFPLSTSSLAYVNIAISVFSIIFATSVTFYINR